MKIENLEIFSINSEEFKNYGRVYNYDCSEIVEICEKIALPEKGTRYVPSEPSLEKAEINKTIKREVFGNMPIQTGFCWGTNVNMDALEWHKNSEINICGTDCVLFLAKYEEMNGSFEIHTDKVKAFVARKGDCFEMFATTLHYCPCNADNDHFRSIVILPLGTNTDLSEKCDDKLITANNKWLICHDKCTELLTKGVVGGVHGVNFKVEN